MSRPNKTVVIGAGPVGSLAALYAAQRGDGVEVYELRGDPRTKSSTPLNFTKSINLALSERGINALRHAGSIELLNTVLDRTIPMYGRMVHVRSPDGQLVANSQPYDIHGRFQRSVDRGELNVVLLDQLSSLQNVKLFFNHKLTGADFRHKKAWLEAQDPANKQSARDTEIEIDFDLLIGADGAHSAVRHHMMKYARIDYQQEYIDCLWCEFTMSPSPSGDFRISPNHLHIWPAGTFMFIALPSLDKSFVCTLFGPASLFERLEADPDTELPATFDAHFPGVLPDLITKDDLLTQFKRNPHLPLINIKCTPHHYSDSAVIVGDAANAIVPFYGQGMNAGLESVRVLSDKLDHFQDRAVALKNYTLTRTPDAHAIADLALQNYVEMRSSVTSPLYKVRKFIEERLDRYAPFLGWATQYSRVCFSNMPYSEATRKAKSQKTILVMLLATMMSSLGIGMSGALLTYILRRRRTRMSLR